jgi:hypothetical protein
MDFSRQVNYQSDFDVLLHITDIDGKAVGYPTFDFVATFTTSGGGKYEAGQMAGVKRGVSDQDGDVRVVFNNHMLSPGVLNLKLCVDIPDAIYPDGKKQTVVSVETGIKLISGTGTDSTGLKVDVILPFAYTAPEATDGTEDSGSEG